MYKNFKLTDKERKEILEQHGKYGYKKPLNEVWSDEEMHYGLEDDDDDDDDDGWQPQPSDRDIRREKERQLYQDKLERRRNGEETPEDRIGDDVHFTQNEKRYEGFIHSVFKSDGEDIFLIKYHEDNGDGYFTGLTKDKFTITKRR